MTKNYCDKCKEEFDETDLYQETIPIRIPTVYLSGRCRNLRPVTQEVQLCATCRKRWASWNRKFLEEE